MPVWNSFLHFVQALQRVTDPTERQALADDLLAQRTEWPWVEGDRATFVFQGSNVTSAAGSWSVAGEYFAEMNSGSGKLEVFIESTLKNQRGREQARGRIGGTHAAPSVRRP